MHFYLLTLSDSDYTVHDLVEDHGLGSGDMKFDAIRFEVHGGMFSLDDDALHCALPVREIDIEMPHPFAGGAYTDTLIATTAEDGNTPKKYFFVDAVRTPDGEWHEFEPSAGGEWDDMVSKWLDEADDDCIAAYYECHRQ